MISFARILVRAAVRKAGARMAWIQLEDWSGVCSLGELRDHVPKLRTRSGLINAAFHAPSVQLGCQKTKGGWAIGDAWLVVWTGTRTRYLTKALMDVMTTACRSWPEGFLGDNPELFVPIASCRQHAMSGWYVRYQAAPEREQPQRFLTCYVKRRKCIMQFMHSPLSYSVNSTTGQFRRDDSQGPRPPEA